MTSIRNGELIQSITLWNGQTLEVALERLLLSTEYLRIVPESLDLTRELFRSVTIVHDVAYATREFVTENPITLFEGVKSKEQYDLVDGNHRVYAAHKLGMSRLNARFVPCAVWHKFIIVSVVPRNREFGQARQSQVWFYTPESIPTGSKV